MSRLKKFGYGTLQLGELVPWPIYDSSGKLLLGKGEIVETESQLEMLISRGIYLVEDDGTAVDEEPIRTAKAPDPFTELQHWLQDFERCMSLLSERRPDSEIAIRLLAHRIIALTKDDPDACLAQLHLHAIEPSPAVLTLFYATLAALAGRALDFKGSRLEIAVAAAITANVSLLPYQEKLNQSTRGLTDKLREIINKHPLLTTTLMRQCGITHPLWLQAIEQHHENEEGTGYPLGLKKDQLVPEARLISLAERYVAMVTVRGYRRRFLPHEALREILLNSHQQDRLDPMYQTFCREISRHPPGSFVKLANGETGLVIRRGQDNEPPAIRAVITATGIPYLGGPERDSRRREFSIVSAMPQPTALSLDLPALWGYR